LRAITQSGTRLPCRTRREQPAGGKVENYGVDVPKQIWVRLFQEEMDFVKRTTKLSEFAPPFMPEELGRGTSAIGPNKSGPAVTVR
jgi:hypothetical protein